MPAGYSTKVAEHLAKITGKPIVPATDMFAATWDQQGFVVYSNEAKQALLGVPESVLREHGAVSGPSADAMARGARERAGTDIGVAVTGIAGPDGGTKEKPVGYVCVCVKAADGRAIARDPVIPGGRDDIRERSALVGMHLLRMLLGGDEPPL